MVAVHAWSSIRARDEVCGLGQGTTEVDVEVGHLCLDLEGLIVGRHSSRCEGLLLLALIHLLGTWVSKGREKSRGAVPRLLLEIAKRS